MQKKRRMKEVKLLLHKDNRKSGFGCCQLSDNSSSETEMRVIQYGDYYGICTDIRMKEEMTSFTMH